MRVAAGEASSLFGRVSDSIYWNTLLLPVVALCTTLTSVLIRRRFGLASGAYDVLLGLVNTVLFYSSFGIPTSLAKILPEREIASGRLAVERLLRRAGSLRFAILAVFIAVLNLWAARSRRSSISGWEESSTCVCLAGLSLRGRRPIS